MTRLNTYRANDMIRVKRLGLERFKKSRYGDKKEFVRAAKESRKRDGNKCRRCGRTYGLQTHHRIPVSKGGSVTGLYNLQTLCKSCHELEHRHLWRRR